AGGRAEGPGGRDAVDARRGREGRCGRRSDGLVVEAVADVAEPARWRTRGGWGVLGRGEEEGEGVVERLSRTRSGVGRGGAAEAEGAAGGGVAVAPAPARGGVLHPVEEAGGELEGERPRALRPEPDLVPGPRRLDAGRRRLDDGGERPARLVGPPHALPHPPGEHDAEAGAGVRGRPHRAAGGVVVDPGDVVDAGVEETGGQGECAGPVSSTGGTATGCGGVEQRRGGCVSTPLNPATPACPSPRTSVPSASSAPPATAPAPSRTSSAP